MRLLSSMSVNMRRGAFLCDYDSLCEDVYTHVCSSETRADHTSRGFLQIQKADISTPTVFSDSG